MVDILTCPNGLVLWPEDNVCAPQVDECEAWEVPVIGGGCMAVGPRACPKLWDPEADVDCEPGELMDYDGEPCPEGFVLAEDEVACIPFFEEDGVCGELEIPVLGGGCQHVGPEWAVPDQPLFDECGDGLLALPGGGCVMIGPRGCPKVWDPDADVVCEVGDVLPCPEGWLESDDGMFCHPGWDECPHGEVPLTGGGCERLLPLPEDCPAGPFPEVPDGATDVLYVLADSPCIESCGSEAVPYSSIQDAIDAAPVGATVLVGPGTYDEGLTLEKSVHVHGLCSALVEVTGKGLVLPDGDSKVLEAGVGIYDVQGVSLSRIRVDCPSTGFAIVGATDVVLDQLDITESHGVALYIDGGSRVEADDLWIHDTATGSGQMAQGSGLWVGGAAIFEAAGVIVEETRKVSIDATGAGTRLYLTDGVIRNTDPDSNGKFGLGIRAVDGSRVSLSDSLLEGHRIVGLLGRDSGTEVEVSGSVLRTTLPDNDGLFGRGIEAMDGCSVVLSGSLLEENREAGVSVADSGTEVEVSGSVIRKTLRGEYAQEGQGIYAREGSKVTVSGSLLVENKVLSLGAAHSGTVVEVSGCVIGETETDENGQGGIGVHSRDRSRVMISRSLLENSYCGLSVIDADTMVEVSGSVIRGTEQDDGAVAGAGVMTAGGSKVTVSDSLLEENGLSGVLVYHSGTVVEVSGSVIRKTALDRGINFGSGIDAYEGSAVQVSGSLLEENQGFGLFVANPGTDVEVSGTVIRKTLQNKDGKGGGGIMAEGGSRVTVRGSLLDESTGLGLGVDTPGTTVEVSDSVVRKTMPTEAGIGGRGIEVGGGSAVVLAGSLLEQNTEVGLLVAQSGTELALTDSAIRRTLPDQSGKNGNGILVQEGSTISVSRSLLEENREVSFAVVNSGTVVEVSGSVIRKTLPCGDIGSAVQAQEGSKVSLAGSVLARNTDLGIFLAGTGTEMLVTGTVIRETLSNSKGMFGDGLGIFLGGFADVSWCRIDGNRTTGVVVHGRSEYLSEGPSLLHLRTSVVVGTDGGGAASAEGELVFFGDGVVAVAGSEALLDSVSLVGNERTGIYYYGSEGAVSGSVIEGNGSYGLAMEGSAQFVDYSDSFIFGNALMAVTDSPQGLPLPPMPESQAQFDPLQ